MLRKGLIGSFFIGSFRGGEGPDFVGWPRLRGETRILRQTYTRGACLFLFSLSLELFDDDAR